MGSLFCPRFYCPGFAQSPLAFSNFVKTAICIIDAKHHDLRHHACFQGGIAGSKRSLVMQVVCRLPSLQTLDGKAVNQAERDVAQGVVQHEGAMLAVMLSSACLCHKLVRACIRSGQPRRHLWG